MRQGTTVHVSPDDRRRHEAVVPSVDDKNRIQALERTLPGLPPKEGRPATAAHDDERHGTTTLLAALNVLDGTVLGCCMRRHRQQEFPRFLDTVEAALPAGRLVPCILDNHAAHEHPKVLARPGRHPRWTFHLVPASCSWLNAVETFFAKLTNRRLRRGTSHSLVASREATDRLVEKHNRDPRPSVWAADPDAVVEKVRRGCHALAVLARQAG